MKMTKRRKQLQDKLRKKFGWKTESSAFGVVAIWLTILNGVRVCYKQDLGWQLLVLAAAWTGVITHLMHIY